MSDIEVPSQLENENGSWYDRFLTFLHLGPSRKLLKAVHAYEDEENRKRIEAQKSPKKPSEFPSGAWKNAHEQFRWKERAQFYDVEVQKQEEEEYERNRKAIMNRGFPRYSMNVFENLTNLQINYAPIDSMKIICGLLAVKAVR